MRKFNFKNSSSNSAGRVFKFAVLSALLSVVAISNASAFQLGVMGGASFGAVNSPLVDAYIGEAGVTSKFAVSPDVNLSIPHNYGSSNWFGQAELGFMGSSFQIAYNVGYAIRFNEKFSLAPFAGVVIPFFYGFGFDVGAIARVPLGIGDLTFDIRYIPAFGILASRQMASVSVGYTFLFGKDKR